jgi:hypothetical protein
MFKVSWKSLQVATSPVVELARNGRVSAFDLAVLPLDDMSNSLSTGKHGMRRLVCHVPRRSDATSPPSSKQCTSTLRLQTSRASWFPSWSSCGIRSRATYRHPIRPRLCRLQVCHSMSVAMGSHLAMATFLDLPGSGTEAHMATKRWA